jgi:uncharacterized membrane protein
VRSIAIRPKVYLAVLVGVLAACFLPATIAGNFRTAISFDAGAIVYIAFSLYLMQACSSAEMRRRAAVQDDGAAMILLLAMLAVAFSFWTLLGVLSEAKQASGTGKTLHVVMAAATILLFWLVTQIAFTFHYAHEFYQPDEGPEPFEGGLAFPGNGPPDYWDFFYFSTSIGAASQTSDVSIRTKSLRRLVTLHAILSFFFNTAVLALEAGQRRQVRGLDSQPTSLDAPGGGDRRRARR